MSYLTLPSQKTIESTMAALTNRNFHPELLENKQQALERIKALIPDGADIMTGGSTTLEQIGLTTLLKSGQHPWHNLKASILEETDPVKQAQLRRESVLATFFLGSVNAVTESGQLMLVSATGSQLPSAAFTSPNVIWVVGTQKIVPDLDYAFKRMHEHTVPLEDERMKQIGQPGTTLAKILILEREPLPTRTLRLLFVNEALGF